jgi:hypothetical protein
VKGQQVTLSWRGSAYAESYHVKRSTSSGGPYTTIATVGNKNLYYVDVGLAIGEIYYYVVSANTPNGESRNTEETAATANNQLYGTIIGTDGSWINAGLTKETVFDGSMQNYFDAPEEVGWAGLDLGEGVKAVITQVRYAPRADYSSRMVGGIIQGSNTADFSSGVTDLFTIVDEPPSDTFTTQNINHTTPFRYVRYLGPADNGYGNVSEVQIFGDVQGLGVPSSPSIRLELDDNNNIVVSWDPIPSTTSYNVKRATEETGPFLVIENWTGTSYTDTALPAGTTYFYEVSALNSAGESPNSPSFSITTPE